MSGMVIQVPPLTRAGIRQVARKIRLINKLWTGLDEAYFPIYEFLDITLPRHFEAFTLEVIDRGELGETHGLTLPDEGRIQIREDVLLGASQEKGRDRMTMAHELGHLVLHANLGFARMMREAKSIPRYESSEWQAKAFGGELLVSVDHIHRCRSPKEAALLFGVSQVAADCQWEVFEREGLIKKR